jgi:hypothetical protein
MSGPILHKIMHHPMAGKVMAGVLEDRLGGSSLPAEDGTALIPVMSGPTNGDVTVSASSEGSGTLPAWEAADGVVSTASYWLSASTFPTGPEWWKVDLGVGNEAPVYEYDIGAAGNTVRNRDPQAWTFQGSNDDANWVDLDSQSGVSSWTIGEAKTYRPSTVGLYRYYRWLITATNSDARVHLDSMQAYS